VTGRGATPNLRKTEFKSQMLPEMYHVLSNLTTPLTTLFHMSFLITLFCMPTACCDTDDSEDISDTGQSDTYSDYAQPGETLYRVPYEASYQELDEDTRDEDTRDDGCCL
jgi:hypothetical protein